MIDLQCNRRPLPVYSVRDDYPRSLKIINAEKKVEHASI